MVFRTRSNKSLIILVVDQMTIRSTLHTFIHYNYMYIFTFYSNTLRNLIIGTMQFFITCYLDNINKKLIISFVNHLYGIKIDKTNVHCSFSNKKSLYYIQHLFLNNLRNFVKINCFPFKKKQIKPLNTIQKQFK